MGKQVELGFSRCVRYVPAEFRVDPYIEVKRSNGGQSHVTCVATPSTHPDQDKSRSVNVL